MLSINTNTAAMQAQEALASAGATLSTSLNRVSTGLKVATAKDDAATWAIGQNIRASLGAWGAADQSLARGQSLLDIAQSGTSEILDVLGRMKADAVTLQDPSLDGASRSAVINDLQALSSQIDKVALNTEFGGHRPLADALTQATVTSSFTSYAIPSAPLTPPSLSAPMQSQSGGGTQVFTRDAGPNAGRIDIYLQAYTVPDVLEVYQNGVRVAATGQAYVGGGGAVGAGQPVSGESVLSFDYNPAAGQNLQFQFNVGRNADNSLWDVDGVTLLSAASPLPTPTVTTVTSTQTTSVASSYNFISDANGGTTPVQAQPLTADALGLDAIDWNDPGSIIGVIDSAAQTATTAATYFGERQQAFDHTLTQNHAVEDALTTGLGNLVDANLAQESAKLQAAQVRQQLAVQTLNIADQGSQILLSLFK